MISREPLERSTRQLITQARQREQVLSQVDNVMAEVTGTASDVDRTIEITVNARGKLLGLWLSADVARWGPERLGRLIVEVARAAMDEATQASYNKLAPLLGDNLTAAIEQLSGRAAPARAPGADPSGGLSAEEFQRRRDERVRRTGRGGGPADEELAGFDPSMLRSDR
ncbi:MAG: YbaB/EbfC family DNA-binding protein [Pseudonocardiaceae bacterium]|nr:YbaB/EbfC family DNA-binding protein [Pseudonocardiaceae bacterium]